MNEIELLLSKHISSLIFMSKRVTITPHTEGTIKGLAQAPIYLHNIIAELVDNAIAAKPSNFNILVDISEHTDAADHFIIRVQDDGPGISLADLETRVFKLGAPPLPGSIHLNEHGFGLKNVLSKAQKVSNYPWSLMTRDAVALERNIFYNVDSPLGESISLQDDKNSSDWPSSGPTSTGTIVNLEFPLSYVQTVAHGRRGQYPRVLGTIMEYLREHLGVYYRGYLDGGRRAIGLISTSMNGSSPDSVDPIFPDYKSKTNVKTTVTHEGKTFTLEGEVGLIEKNSPKTKSRKYYYRHAPDSQGIDFRIGNRVMATRLISEIWELERHPTLNGIAGEIRMSDSNPDVIPPTLNNKTSIDYDSKVWLAIAEKIQADVPKDSLPLGGGKTEDDLRHELYEHIDALKRPGDEVHEEYDCGHNVLVDVMWDSSSGGAVDIFEVKKGKSAPLDVYQLVMYWDCLVAMGVQPTSGHLVCESPSHNVTHFIIIMNTRTDANGNTYNLKVDTWESHRIKVNE